ILAKVTRDRMMIEYDKQYPQYGFARHKGYSAKEHFAALDEHGPCPLHRMTFIDHRQMRFF
ncbi:MAG TPA: ribonuclease HII, partial [Symbiobacteriaceae bacterium]|nr:ribonuclease HII [Symbiobacteriaceae bacterium]